MKGELKADFVKRFPAGAEIHGALSQRVDGFCVTALFGPSGCGKTTILRCLAGLERPEQGQVLFDGSTWSDASTGAFVPPQRRGVGMLFQDYALFPHLTVSRNIAYGLSRPTGAEARARVGELMERFGLAGLENRLPHQVSGGQQQRIALARTVAARPRLLLLDEPLSALDAQTRQQLRRELREILVGLRLPVVLVTHDWLEAAALSDAVVVLEHGKVRQAGPTHEVFSRPADLAVAAIVGVESVVPGRIVRVEHGLAEVQTQGVRLLADASGLAGGEVFLCIRAENVVLEQRTEDSVSARNRLAATVRRVTEEGPLVRVELDCGFLLNALLTRPAREEMHLREGDRVQALVKATAVHLVPRGTGAGGVQSTEGSI